MLWKSLVKYVIVLSSLEGLILFIMVNAPIKVAFHSSKAPQVNATNQNHHLTNKYNNKAIYMCWCWTLLHIAKYFACQQGIFYQTKSESTWHENMQKNLMMWHGICYKDSLLFTWAHSPSHHLLFVVHLLMLLNLISHLFERFAIT